MSLYIITRMECPGPLDQLDYNTLCKVKTDLDTFDLYIQTSNDSTNPIWKLLGNYKDII